MYMSKKAEKNNEKNEQNRRRGLSRRLYSYAHHIPERRSGEERRNGNNLPDATDKNLPHSQHNFFDEVPNEEFSTGERPMQDPIKKNPR
jgi:hypothetical protein